MKPGSPGGWGEQLIKKGILTVGAKPLDLEIGEWANQNSAPRWYSWLSRLLPENLSTPAE